MLIYKKICQNFSKKKSIMKNFYQDFLKILDFARIYNTILSTDYNYLYYNYCIFLIFYYYYYTSLLINYVNLAINYVEQSYYKIIIKIIISIKIQFVCQNII